MRVAEHTAPMPQIAIRGCPLLGYSSAGPHSASQFMHHRAGKFIFKGNLSAGKRSGERRWFSMRGFQKSATMILIKNNLSGWLCLAPRSWLPPCHHACSVAGSLLRDTGRPGTQVSAYTPTEVGKLWALPLRRPTLLAIQRASSKNQPVEYRPMRRRASGWLRLRAAAPGCPRPV